VKSTVKETVMTTTASAPAPTREGRASHPLDRLTETEIHATRETLESARIATDTTRFVYVGLEEPHKNLVLAFRAGDDVPRRVRCFLLETDTGTGHDVTVDVAGRAVVRHEVLDAATAGQMPVLDEEFEIIEGILLDDPRWVGAMTARGLEPADVRAVPLSAGVFGHDDEVGVRLVRVLGFHQADPQDLPWAHPVDGVVAYVDLIRKVVTQVIDHQDLPVPRERGEWDAEPHGASPRTTLKPIEITQPQGPSFSVEGDVVTWEKWKFRIGFDGREGLTLHQISFTDGERERPVVYRASISEMVVPYADPSPVRYWQNYFDAGEYMYARYTNSLRLGCDCLGEIHYFDATLADERCQPRTIANAICMHEEDFGILWKHTDMFNGMNETRRRRRLVISFFLTIGNYDYGFYWHLYLDGTIQLECKATGIVFTSAFTDQHGEFTSEIAPGLGAPFHQHLFSARLDMMVDGVANAVDEVDAVRVPVSDANPYGNAFTRSITRLRSESQAQRTNDGSVGRVWHSEPGGEEPPRPARRLRAAPGEPAGAAGRRQLVDPPARHLRHQEPVGDALRPRRAVRRRRLREPAPGWWRPPVVRRGGQGPRRAGHRRVAHLRAHPLPPPRGLAGHAGRLRRLHPEAPRVLRPEPHSRRPRIDGRPRTLPWLTWAALSSA
jgi:primary-amine oxidase